jgi:hypothetical protein
VLLAGDAFCTIDQDSMLGIVTKKPQVNRPPAYYTINWDQARESVRKLAELSPRLLAAGHGEPMGGDEALRQLRELAENFPAPTYGRYVRQPPIVNQYGVALMPPPVADPVKRVAIGAIVAGTIAAIGVSAFRRRAASRAEGSDRQSSQPEWRSALEEDSQDESPAESATRASARWNWRKPA